MLLVFGNVIAVILLAGVVAVLLKWFSRLIVECWLNCLSGFWPPGNTVIKFLLLADNVDLPVIWERCLNPRFNEFKWWELHGKKGSSIHPCGKSKKKNNIMFKRSYTQNNYAKIVHIYFKQYKVYNTHKDINYTLFERLKLLLCLVGIIFRKLYF